MLSVVDPTWNHNCGDFSVPHKYGDDGANTPTHVKPPIRIRRYGFQTNGITN